MHANGFHEQIGGRWFAVFYRRSRAAAWEETATVQPDRLDSILEAILYRTGEQQPDRTLICRPGIWIVEVGRPNGRLVYTKAEWEAARKELLGAE